jgi:hypothetical protein
MGLFDGVPTYARNRSLSLAALRDAEPAEDVYALQMALVECGFDPGGNDGVFGIETDKAVRVAQRNYRLDVDGIAGGATQAKLTSVLCLKARAAHGLPSGLAYGQCMHESGCRLGIYSWIIRPGGFYDAGVAQLNTSIFPPAQGFDPAAGIEELSSNAREHFDLFDGVPTARRWKLAAGAHNAPAFACYLANREGADVPGSRLPRYTPSRQALEALEAYIASATALMKL